MKKDEIVRLYASDIAILKDYGIKRKISLHKSIRNTGFEIEMQKRQKGEANDEKLAQNIIHSRGRIFELAYCNPWDLFITLTIDPRRYNRHDLNKYQRDLTQWIRDYNKKHDLQVKYLLIPEMHKDGAWHMHGFLMGLPESHLMINKNGYQDWMPYRDKFGYCSIDIIRNHEAASKYITKYISKDLIDNVRELNAHMYYCSNGLQRALEIKRGTLTAMNVPWDYENEWVKCKWFDSPASELVTVIV